MAPWYAVIYIRFLKVSHQVVQFKSTQLINHRYKPSATRFRSKCIHAVMPSMQSMGVAQACWEAIKVYFHFVLTLRRKFSCFHNFQNSPDPPCWCRDYHCVSWHLTLHHGRDYSNSDPTYVNSLIREQKSEDFAELRDIYITP